MRKAKYSDKNLLLDIHTKSLNCAMFGKVLLSNDRRACSLVFYLDKKQTTLKSIWLDLKLIFTCVGLSNVFKAMNRESSMENG